MKQIAIDVVLLPSEEMMNKAIESNSHLSGEGSKKIQLDQETCLPHISLCMGCVNENDLPRLKEILEVIAANLPIYTLTATKIDSEIIPTKEIFSWFDIQESKEIQSLYTDVVREFHPFLHYPAQEEYFFNPQEIEKITIDWVNGYEKKLQNSSLFHPHSSIGVGRMIHSDISFPFDFTVSRIAICQLGNYCTCRKIIHSFLITNP